MLLSFIALFLTAAALSRPQVHDVIVIGAGVSGLRASQILHDHHVPHLILESTNRTGGRVTPLDFAGTLVDKGASFIHNAHENNPIASLAKKRGWPTSDATCSYRVMYLQGIRGKSLPWGTIEKARKRYFSISNWILDKYDEEEDVSVCRAFSESKKHLDVKDPLEKQLVGWMFEILGNIDGTSLCSVSSKNVDYNETKPDLFPIPGYFKLIDSLFEGRRAPIHFNQRVRAVDYEGEVVQIKTDSKTYLAKKVIATFPLGVLKARSVAFHPPLPKPHNQAIESIGFGFANKLFASFSKPFWGAGDRWLSFVRKGQLNRYPSAFVVPREDKHILIFFVSGEYSLQISSWSDAQIKQDLTDHLSRFQAMSVIQLEEVKQTRWHLDQNSMGSYSYYRVGTTSGDFRELGKPVEDKLWLAGEHTSPELDSYVHGAYLTGERAAQQVLSSLERDRKTVK